MMRELLIRIPWVKAWHDEVLRAGSIDAFHKAHADIRETMADDLDKKADELARDKLSKLLSVVDERMVATFSSTQKKVFIGGVEADAAQLGNLKAEAELLVASSLWPILYETPKRLAMKSMFESGESIDDMKKGRSVLYTLETQKKIIDMLKSYEPRK